MLHDVLAVPPDVAFGEGDDLRSLEAADVVEVPLLLSGRQMLALEEAAHTQGLTAGEMLRRMLQEFISHALHGLPPRASA